MAVSFSVIITCFNKGRYIEETIRSVICQSYLDYEILLIDDCSTDNSRDIIHQFILANSSIRVWWNEVNKGANYCRNLGLKNAMNEFVIFLDGDDLLDCDCLHKRSLEINSNPINDFWVFSMYSFLESKYSVVSTWKPSENNFLNEFLSHRLPWTISQPVWRKKFLIQLEGFDETFKRLQDVELHTRALLQGARVFISSTAPDCFYRVDAARILNFENHFRLQAEGSLMYFKKFYPQIKSNKKIYGTVLMVIDAVWEGMRSKKISRIFANHTVENLLTEIFICSNSSKNVNYLRWYWKIKSKFAFNVKGIRYLFSRLIQI
jgi:glycosyltransferase involved in cell wall biosynthesis